MKPKKKSGSWFEHEVKEFANEMASIVKEIKREAYQEIFKEIEKIQRKWCVCCDSRFERDWKKLKKKFGVK